MIVKMVYLRPKWVFRSVKSVSSTTCDSFIVSIKMNRSPNMQAPYIPVDKTWFCERAVQNASVVREGTEAVAVYRAMVFHHAHLAENVEFTGRGPTEAEALSDLHRDCMKWDSQAWK